MCGVLSNTWRWALGPQCCVLRAELPSAGSLCALAADAARQLDVLGHDGDALGVDGAQVGVLKQAHQVGLGGLLQRQHRGGLEAQVGLQTQGGEEGGGT